MTASLPDRLRKAADEFDSLRLAGDAALMREAAEALTDAAVRERSALPMHRLDFTAGTVEVVDGNQPPAGFGRQFRCVQHWRQVEDLGWHAVWRESMPAVRLAPGWRYSRP